MSSLRIIFNPSVSFLFVLINCVWLNKLYWLISSYAQNEFFHYCTFLIFESTVFTNPAMIFSGNILFVASWISPLKNCKKYYLPRRIHVLCWKRLSQVRTPSESLDLINTAPENGVILNYIFTFGNVISKVIKDEGLSNLMAFYVEQEVTRINWMIPNIVTSVVRVKLFFARINFFVPFDWRLKFRSFIALCLLQTFDWCMIPADKVSCQ